MGWADRYKRLAGGEERNKMGMKKTLGFMLTVAAATLGGRLRRLGGIPTVTGMRSGRRGALSRWLHYITRFLRTM